MPLLLQLLLLHGCRAKAGRLLVEVGQEGQGADDEEAGGDEELVLAPAEQSPRHTETLASNSLIQARMVWGKWGCTRWSGASAQRTPEPTRTCVQPHGRVCATLIRYLLGFAVCHDNLCCCAIRCQLHSLVLCYGRILAGGHGSGHAPKSSSHSHSRTQPGTTCCCSSPGRVLSCEYHYCQQRPVQTPARHSLVGVAALRHDLLAQLLLARHHRLGVVAASGVALELLEAAEVRRAQGQGRVKEERLGAGARVPREGCSSAELRRCPWRGLEQRCGARRKASRGLRCMGKRGMQRGMGGQTA